MSRIHHIGIAVQDIVEAAQLYTEGLGLALHHIEEIKEQGVKVGFLPLGESEIELLEPLGEESPIARFLERRGEGIHHICVQVPDIRQAMARLRAFGARLLSDEPQPGAGGSLVVFVHPKSGHGVLLELSQEATRESGSDD